MGQPPTDFPNLQNVEVPIGAKIGCVADDTTSGIYKVEFKLTGSAGTFEEKIYTYGEPNGSPNPVTRELSVNPSKWNAETVEIPVFWYENESVPIQLDAYFCELDRMGVKPGTYTLEITAFDRAGNTTTQTIPTLKVNGRSIDVTFVVDTTSSMDSHLALAKGAIHNTINEVRDIFPDARFGVVDYRDYPEAPPAGPPAGPDTDYPFRTVQPFTKDISDVISAVNSLNTFGDFGTEQRETLVSALNHVLGWRGGSMARPSHGENDRRSQRRAAPGPRTGWYCCRGRRPSADGTHSQGAEPNDKSSARRADQAGIDDLRQ